MCLLLAARHRILKTAADLQFERKALSYESTNPLYFRNELSKFSYLFLGYHYISRHVTLYYAYVRCNQVISSLSVARTSYATTGAVAFLATIFHLFID